MPAPQPIQKPFRLCRLAGAHEDTSHSARERQAGRGAIGQRNAHQAFGFARAVGDIGDHGAMQRVNAALAAGFRKGTERGQRRICLPTALLRPGQQQGLQQRRKPLARQGAEALFCPVIAPGLRILPGQEHGGEGFIRDHARKPRGIGTPIQQGGDEGALHDLRLTGIKPQSLDQTVGSVFRIGFIGSETPGQIGPEGAGHFRRRTAERRAVHAIPSRTGGKQRGGKQPKAAGREERSHAFSLAAHSRQTKTCLAYSSVMPAARMTAPNSSTSRRASASNSASVIALVVAPPACALSRTEACSAAALITAFSLS